MNIKPIALHNMKCFVDSIHFLYNQNKADQEGAKTTTKHVCPNPKNLFICPLLVLGIWISLNLHQFEQAEYLFKYTDNDKKKVELHGYCSQLKAILKQYANVVVMFMHLAHANTHGWQKGPPCTQPVEQHPPLYPLWPDAENG